MKVRIKKLGKKAYGGQNSNLGLDINPTSFGGGDYSMSKGAKGIEVRNTITADPRNQSNLEAEGGETAFGPISGDAIPDHMVIKGPRHSNGGVPLNLPDDTFIFSDTKAMKITDPVILKMFDKTKKKGGYTPAELAKPYDISKYKAILMDPDSDELSRNTAEIMIKNMIIKLGALALAQESKKGFPQGIPEMARPYMEQAGISEEDVLPNIPEQAPQEMMPPQGAPQQMAQQPMMAPPTQMPSGQPIAQATPMPPQPGMMAFGGPAELDKFVYSDGGLYRAQYGDDGKKKRKMTTAELKGELAKQKNIRRKPGTECGPGFVLVNGVCVRGSIGEGSVKGGKEYEREFAPTGGSNANLIDDLCNSMQTEGAVHYGKSASDVLIYAGYKEGTPLYEKHLKTLLGCQVKGEATDTEFQAYELTQDEKICKCVDPTNGETYKFPLPEGEEECPCVELIEQGKRDGSITTKQRTNNPMISDVDANQMMAMAKQNPNVAPTQLVAPGRTETAPAYDELYTQGMESAARERTEGSKPTSLADQAAIGSSAQAAFMKGLNDMTGKVRMNNTATQNKFNLAKTRLDSIYENAFANTMSKQNMLNAQNANQYTQNRNQKITGMASSYKMAEDNKRNLAWLLANPDIAEQYTASFRDPSKIYFKDPKKLTPTDEMTMAERAQAAAQINKFFPGEMNSEARKRELEMSIYGPNANKKTPTVKFGGYLPIHVGNLYT